MDKYKLTEMLESGMSMNDIAKKEKKGLTTIRYWCNKFDIKSKHTSFKDSNPIYHKCNTCGETDPLNFNGHKKTQCKKCQNPKTYPKVKEWRKNTKLKLIEGFGSVCSCCGLIDSPLVYDFHHLDPNEKDFSLSSKVKSWDVIVNEANKCIMICSHCHRKIHSGLVEIINPIKFDETKVKSNK
jgi:hypothetical protein